MRLDASTAEVAQFLRAEGYKLTVPVDAELYEDRARVAVQGGNGNQYVIVTRDEGGKLCTALDRDQARQRPHQVDWLAMEEDTYQDASKRNALALAAIGGVTPNHQTPNEGTLSHDGVYIHYRCSGDHVRVTIDLPADRALAVVRKAWEGR